jgi:hypothetical protein
MCMAQIPDAKGGKLKQFAGITHVITEIALE